MSRMMAGFLANRRRCLRASLAGLGLALLAGCQSGAGTTVGPDRIGDLDIDGLVAGRDPTSFRIYGSSNFVGWNEDPDLISTPGDVQTTIGMVALEPPTDPIIWPSLAHDLLVAFGETGQTDLALLEGATGSGGGVALLCGLSSAPIPDVILMGRLPRQSEVDRCAQEGRALQWTQLATHTGGLVFDGVTVQGIWLVWDESWRTESSATAAFVDFAPAAAPDFINAPPYVSYFDPI